ncbi:MAG TPA: benzaldehyde dehydrogenase [Candidatus Lustribacter sp.]|nr:benzaldehyde dehydrogenase [Candidatus Lustribacter sp.]
MIEERVQPLLDPAKWQGKIYSNGWRDAAGGTTDVTDKSTGASIGRTGVANKADIAEAAKRAKAALPAWSATPPAKRAEILRKAADLLEKAHNEVADFDVRETGGIRPKADFEVSVATGELREAAGLAEASNERRVIDKNDEVESIAIRVPIGVVGVISPWNAPLILSMRSVAPALAVGCTVVLKPDIQTPVSGGFVIAAALAAAGLPDGVLHVLPGDAEPGAALCSDPNVNMISFTGSTQVGRLVGEAAGRTLKRVALELGGNSPFIVLDDADLELATSAGAFGSFFFQGQICMASSRHLVHEKIAPAYIAKLTERTAKLGIGNPATDHVHLGPLINDQQLERVTRIVDSSVKAGAKASTGGTHEGRFYRPTVLTGVTPAMAAFNEEIFGPVAPVTTFKNDEEAIELANRTEYGLAAAIFSNDVDRAMKMAERLNVGLVHINDQTINDDPRIPFGGTGASGNGGRFGSVSNLEEFTTWRWMTIRAKGHPYPF